MPLNTTLTQKAFDLRNKNFTINKISKILKISMIQVIELLHEEDKSDINTEYAVYFHPMPVIPGSDPESRKHTTSSAFKLK